MTPEKCLSFAYFPWWANWAYSPSLVQWGGPPTLTQARTEVLQNENSLEEAAKLPLVEPESFCMLPWMESISGVIWKSGNL